MDRHPPIQPTFAPARAAARGGIFVSVIVPVYNDHVGLGRCLEALRQQTYPVDSLEIVVVDNGSDLLPGSLAADFPNVRLVRETRRGSYAARNAGLRIAQGEVVAFTDADCIPHPRWIEAGIRQLAATTGVAVVCGRIDVFPRTPGHPTVFESYDRLFGFQQQFWVRHYGYGATGNLFAYRSLFDEVGVFNPALKSLGDAEWCKRVAARGYALCYCDDARISHPARDSLRALLHKTLRTAGGAYQAIPAQKRPWRVGRLFSALCLPNMHSVKLIFQDREIPTSMQKIGVLFLGVALRLCRIYENLRLVAGRTARNT